MAISYYKKEFAKKDAFAKDHKNAFNLEKEARIINPHKMDLNTTTQEVYKGKRGDRAKIQKPITDFDDAPIVATSHYQ